MKSGKVKTKTRDLVEAQSLFEKAQKRITYLRPLNTDTAALVLEDAYEAAREAAQALMSLNGFKPYSHEATISFLKAYYAEHFDDYDLNQFNRFRELRSNSIYRAEKISPEDAQQCVVFATKLIAKILPLLEKK